MPRYTLLVRAMFMISLSAAVSLAVLLVASASSPASAAGKFSVSGMERALVEMGSRASGSARVAPINGTAYTQILSAEVRSLHPSSTATSAASLLSSSPAPLAPQQVAPPPSTSTRSAVRTYSSSLSQARIMKTVKHLSSVIGQRRAGTAQERKAADYFVKTLKAYGLKPVTRDVWVHGGRKTRNVAAFIKGRKGADGKPLNPGKYIILGAHMDTKAPAPGADDNASGCATVLELARLFKQDPPTVGVKIVFFGAEEIVDSNRDHHHYGSRDMARRVKPGSGLLGVFIVDMIGYGPALHVRTMGRSSPVMWKRMLALKKRAGVSATYKSDPGWSDHEPFEAKGYPVAWIERRPTPYTHSAGDTYAHIKPSMLMSAARWSATYFDRLTQAHIAELAAASPGID